MSAGDATLRLLNPDLDVDALRAEFARDERIRINHFLAPGVATQLRTLCENAVPFDHIYHVDGHNQVVSQAKMAALSAAQRDALGKKLSAQATQGIGFLYDGYRMAQKDEVPRLALLHEIFRMLNSPALLALIMAITGRDDLVDADAQVTRYLPGHFLTRHSDDVPREARRLAYVLNVTETWHPDWGGLLQFYTPDGTPRDAWPPGSNTLSLFDVRHVHAVTYVAPFAARPRLSMTGWFRGARHSPE